MKYHRVSYHNVTQHRYITAAMQEYFEEHMFQGAKRISDKTVLFRR